MANSIDEVPGRKINEICPICKEGRLRPVTRRDHGWNGICGPAGKSWDYHLVQRLGCNHCSASFEAEASIRDVDLKDVLHRQLKGFENPEQRPSDCPACGVKGLDEGEKFVPDFPHASSLPWQKKPGTKTSYLYCKECYIVYWAEVERVTPDAPPMSAEEKASLEAFTQQIADARTKSG